MRFKAFAIFAHLILVGLLFVGYAYADEVLAQVGFPAGSQFVWSDGTTQRTEDQQNMLDDVLAQREAALIEEGEADFGDASEINILLLGLDARVDEDNPRCDAIHMYTLNIDRWDVKITSVPRGTYAYIPIQDLGDNQYYMANACATMGLDYGIEQIEKLTGIKKDYLVTVNFSQALGIFRQLKLPSTETLQWLRHRQSYAIGDPQRSHNQALFMKDMILKYSQEFSSSFTKPIQYMMYSMVHTDMDFKTARVLIDGYVDAEIYNHPEKITLTMKPWHPVVDEHYDEETVAEDMQRKLDYIGPYLSQEDYSNTSIDEIQQALITDLENRYASNDSIDDIVDRQMWLQVEDDGLREDLHWRFLHRYVREHQAEDEDAMADMVTAYIMEKEALEQWDWAEKGKELLETIIK